MGTSTVPSAMKWRQPSRLPTTSSGDICIPACKLHKTPASKLRVVTPDKESRMYTLWQEEEFEQMCSKESLTEKAAEIEKTISAKEHESERHDLDPKMFDENRFWNRRPDGIVINKNHRTPYILEFKRSSDRNEDFLGVKDDKANKQLKSIIEALKAAALELTFEQIKFVAGRRGAVVEDDSYNKFERLSVQAGSRKAQCTSRETSCPRSLSRRERGAARSGWDSRT